MVVLLVLKIMDIHWFTLDIKSVYSTRQEAYNHLYKCNSEIQPNRGFVSQLAQWEEDVHGKRLTDIMDPKF